MPVERPTFSESWYRVATLRPRLRSTVQSYRQHYRGQMWHVLQDPSNNQFSRLNESAYVFVALLDGRRTVAEVWSICNERLGDSAPTQGEAIHILGQLYVSNLLQAEMPPDAAGLFKRHRKRVSREVRGYMSNLLFARIPLFDPDHFLNRWVGVFGKIFTWYGLAAWVAIMMAALYSLAGRFGDLSDASSNILSPSALPLLYLSIVMVKVLHEFGHSFACKKFGLEDGSGGQVHTMGIMFLVFVPLPYMDASSAWAFRSKWRRVTVGAAGILVDLAIAAIAAVIWAKAGQPTLRALMFNVMFIAGVNSLFFNGNPLLRFDAYFILSDLLEIPNLSERAKQYLYYLVKRYAWGVRNPQSPAHTRGERAWFVVYGIAATLYRIFIFTMILLFLSDRLPKALAPVAIVFGVVAGFTWLCVPAGKFVHYLATHNELMRVRPRAIYSTLGVVALLVVALGIIPAPFHARADGLVKPVHEAWIRAESNFHVITYLPSGNVVAKGDKLINYHLPVEKLAAFSPKELSLLTGEQWAQLNPELWEKVNWPMWVELKDRLAERQRLEGERRQAESDAESDPSYRAKAQTLAVEVASADTEIEVVQARLVALAPKARFAGRWIAPDIERLEGVYVSNNRAIGKVISAELVIRAIAVQNIAVDEASRTEVDIRAKGRPGVTYSGKIIEIIPAGFKDLPSASLSQAGGGSIQTEMDDRGGRKAVSRFFDVRIAPVPDPEGREWLLAEQSVLVRFRMPPRPIVSQIWRKIQQVLQKKKARQ